MAKRSTLVLPLLVLAAPAAQAAWQFTPTVTARETWTDNVNLQAPDKAESSWITEFSPGFSLANNSPRLAVKADYRVSMYAYSGGSERPQNTQRNSQSLQADVKARLLEDLLFLEGAASINQAAASAFGPQVNDNPYSNANRNEVRTYRVSPYLMHRFGASAIGQLRLTHDSVSSNALGMRHSVGNTLLATLASGPTFRRVGWNLMLSRQLLEDQLPPRAPGTEGDTQNTSVNTANADLRYQMSPQLNVSANAGYDQYDYQGLGGKQQGAAYGTGLQWTPSTRTSVVANVGHRFYGPSYNLSLQHRSRGTVWNVAYTDAVTNTRSQFLLPAAVDTAAMLDKLFSSQITDAAQRAAAVQAYIHATGLPPRILDSINYFSNRYVLQKQLAVTMAAQLAHSNAVLSVFKTRREALSSTTADSALLGPTDINLNDNTDQVGGSATLSYRFGAQTTANLSATVTKAQSLTTQRDSHNRALRLNVARNFSSKLVGMLEVRRVMGTVGAADTDYTENAVMASVTMKF